MPSRPATAKTTAEPSTGLARLRDPFAADEIGKLPRSTCKACSDSQRKRCEEHTWISNCPACHGRHSSATMHIDYVGHADVTARLLEVDPEWTWRPFTVEELQGIPPAMRVDGVWIMLTVLNVTRPGFGDAPGKFKSAGDQAKEAIGDALRNAAMRFGVALDLWAKGDRDWATTEKHDTEINPPPDPAPPRETVAPPAPYAGPTTAELLLQIDSYAQRAGVTYEQITAKWRAAHGNLSLDDLDTMTPQEIAPLEASLAEYLAKNPPAAAADIPIQ